MFQFPGFARRTNCGVMESLPSGFPIRTSAGRRAFAPHRGFSQLVTSFLASESHRHPPCALSFFPYSFKRESGSSRRPCGGGRRPLGLMTFDRCRSISLNSISRFCRSNGRKSENLQPMVFSLRVPNMSMTSFLFFSVVPGRLELPTSTLSV